MQLLVYARHSLIQQEPAAHRPVLLLEGAWPEAAPDRSHWSLDQTIDGRFDWIDRHADEIAGRLVEHELRQADAHGPALETRFCHVNALDLRYYLVKLLRIVAWFTGVRPLPRSGTLTFVGQRDRDEDYADLLAEVCRITGAQMTAEWRDLPPPKLVYPPNSRLRRWTGRVLQWLDPRRRKDRMRVVLCGNPRLLEPVAHELLACNTALWWLYDRFALRSWLRWRVRGVGHLVCDASLAEEAELSAHLPDRVAFRGVDLAGALHRWATQRLDAHGARQQRLWERIDRHFARVRPDALILDEDATPLGRIAVEAAQGHNARSVVLQHGAPCCRFGFAPLAADRLLAWGRSSRNQFMRWDIPAGQIAITGSPWHDRLHAHFAKTMPGAGAKKNRPRALRRFLLLASVPPRDERADAVALCLTRRSYAQMVETAFDVLSRMSDVSLTVKLHPRAADDPMVRQAMARHPGLAVKLTADTPLERLVDEADCIFSCGSSAGVDAAISGRPVIHIIPLGSSEFLSQDAWGFTAVVRSAADLERTLAKLAQTPAGPIAIDPNVCGDFQYLAVQQIAQTVIELVKSSRVPTAQIGLSPSKKLREAG